MAAVLVALGKVLIKDQCQDPLTELIHTDRRDGLFAGTVAHTVQLYSRLPVLNLQ